MNKKGHAGHFNKLYVRKAKDGNLNLVPYQRAEGRPSCGPCTLHPDHEGQAGSPLACGNPPRTGRVDETTLGRCCLSHQLFPFPSCKFCPPAAPVVTTISASSLAFLNDTTRHDPTYDLLRLFPFFGFLSSPDSRVLVPSNTLRYDCHRSQFKLLSTPPTPLRSWSPHIAHAVRSPNRHHTTFSIPRTQTLHRYPAWATPLLLANMCP
jgi:hypothetical protein